MRHVQILSTLLLLITIAAALLGASAAGSLYEWHIQRPLCFDYARDAGIAGIETLTWRSVTIASNQFRGHRCIFDQPGSEAPLVVAFDEEYIPYGVDTGQVLAMIGGFVVGGGAPALLLGFGYLFRPLPRPVRARG